MILLFVCTGNTCRSPMAESLFMAAARQRGLDLRAESAGLAAWPDDPAAAFAVHAVATLGGDDLSGHRARQIKNLDLDRYAWIVTMNRAQKNQLIKQHPSKTDCIQTLGELAGHPELEISDPYGQNQSEYDKTARQIMDLIDRLMDRFDKKI